MEQGFSSTATYLSVVRSCSSIMDIGHWVKTMRTLAMTASDVGSDVVVGLQHYNYENVTRFFENSTLASDWYFNCVPHPDVNDTRMYDCLENDIGVAVGTFALILFPSVVIVITLIVLPTLSHCCTNGFVDCNKQRLLFALLFLLVSSVRSSSGYHGLLHTRSAAQPTFSDFSNSSDSKVKVKVKGPNMCYIFEKHGIQGY